MAIDIATLVFYLFAGLVLFSGGAVVAARNPVHAVLALIFAFFNAAGLLVLLGAEYIAMTLVIVYVGAVAVLFLFVVMMLNVNFVESKQGFSRYLPLGFAVIGLLLLEICALIFSASYDLGVAPTNVVVRSNAHQFGDVLYTDYIYAFQMSGFILLVAMIGAIVLTLRHRQSAKKQRIAKQVARTREQSVALVSPNYGEGV